MNGRREFSRGRRAPKLSESRGLGRRLAAIGLVLGPLLFLLDTVIDPAWAEDDATYLVEVAENEFTYTIAELASTVGALLLIAGMLGVMRLLRGLKVSLGQVAAAIVTVGLIGLTGSFAFSVFDLAMASFEDRGAMVELRAELQDSGPYRAYWLVFFRGATVGGLILLAVAIARRRIVRPWSPAAVIVAALLWSLGGGEQILNATSSLLLAIALTPLAARIWSFSDEAWAEWEIPVRPREKIS